MQVRKKKKEEKEALYSNALSTTPLFVEKKKGNTDIFTICQNIVLALSGDFQVAFTGNGNARFSRVISGQTTCVRTICELL